ncbi:unnamed protein product, partial [Mesorhabditis belari]|uniref:GSKIP domain-containing protein n=1 Tax=Mesorhabditis belari TaxID=2138241 RepID=A0AAF3J2C4_9BILA
MHVLEDSQENYPTFSSALQICGSEVNHLADLIGISPSYMRNEARRWTEAAQIYSNLKKEMPRRKSYSVVRPVHEPRARHTSECPTPVRGGALRHFHRTLSEEARIESLPDLHYRKMMKSEPIPCVRCGVGSSTSPSSLGLSLNKVGSMNRSLAGTGSHSRSDPRSDGTLELEAIAAVHELSFAVQQISVSEILPRTPDLIFVNVTTIEGQPYCLELTLKGWRITSQRSDCMTGDFTNLDLFTKYYDSLYSLMDDISPGYRVRFGEKLAHRLKMLQNDDDSYDCMAPCGSYASPPLSLSSGSPHRSLHSSSDSLPVVTPVSSPTREFEKAIFA